MLLAWEPPQNDGGSPVVSYELQKRKADQISAAVFGPIGVAAAGEYNYTAGGLEAKGWNPKP